MLNVGLVDLAKIVNGVDSVAPFTYMAVGSDNTAENATQTDLIAEITTCGVGRAAATCTYEANYKSKWVHTFQASGCSVTIWEVAVFNASSNGTPLFRHVFDVAQNISNGGALEITGLVAYAQAL